MTRNRSRWCLALLAGLAVGPRAVAAEVDEALLKHAQEGNRAAQAAITSMSFLYERTWVQKPPIEDPKNPHFLVRSGRYWYTPTTYRLQDRLQEQLNGQVRDMVVREGKALVRGYDSRSPKPAIRVMVYDPSVGGDVWDYLIFRHPNREITKQISFSELPSHPHTLNAVRRIPPASGIGLYRLHETP